MLTWAVQQEDRRPYHRRSWAGSARTAPSSATCCKNIGAALKALAPGLTTGGALELKVISDFLGLVAKLPPGLARPLAEVAGAMLILNKIGGGKVISFLVSATFGGLLKGGAGGAAGAAGAASLWSRLAPGARLVGGALVISLILQQVVQNPKNPQVLGNTNPASWWNSWSPFITRFRQNIAGIASAWNTTLAGAKIWAANITRTVTGAWSGIAGGAKLWWGNIKATIAGAWNTTWNNTVGRAGRGVHDVAAWFGNLRAGAALAWVQIRGNAVTAWNTIWNNTVGRVTRGVRDVETWFGNLRAGAALVWTQIRTTAASTWNTIWANTVSRVVTGVSNVMTWVGTLPARIKAMFGYAGFWLINAGQNILQGFWNGMTFIWRKVTGWISSLAGWIKAHKGPVSLDKTLLYPAGQALMEGLRLGLVHGFVDIKDIVSGAASNIGNWLAGAGSAVARGFGVVTGGVGGFFSKLFGGGGSGVQRWRGLVVKALGMEGLSQQLVDSVLYQMQTESGGNPNAINLTDINAQHGDPSRGLMQVIGATFRAYHWPGTSWNIYDPLANIAAAINYARHVYGPGLRNAYGGIGSGHGYASGTSGAAPGWAWVGERGPELVKFCGGEQVLPAGRLGGYATGTAGAGAAFLKAWQTRHGGGVGAAWAPIVLNEQIARMTAAITRAITLSKAGGLSAAQHKHWAYVAGDEKKRLGTLNRELTTERAWRAQLTASDSALSTWISAAGNTPSLRHNVTSWKAQLARQKATITAISKMLGYSNAYLKAHPAAPKLPGVIHTYGGDVAGTNAAFLASALGPFTGPPVTMDKGGWLRPGLNPPMMNATGRPELLVPARGGGAGKITWRSRTGGSSADEFLATMIKKYVKVRGGGDVQRAYGAR